tara:strand:- start:43 stop:939 length:897 start_codon:yes stop_codon:yes gene_type:complete
MKNAQKLRRFIQSEPFCESFTIVCTSNIDTRRTEINGVPLIWKNRNGTKTPIGGGLPQIYIDFYDDISSLIQGNLHYSKSYYDKLNITNVYQDMVDKDNSSSIVFLMLNGLQNPIIHLIGREAFSLLHKSVVIPHYQCLNWEMIPDVIKPINISPFHKNIELNMGQTTTTYWPSFKNTDYELEYSKYDTENHYNLMCMCFEISVNNLLEYYKKSYGVFNTTFSKNIVKVSDNKHMPLMNEVIFFPALNTLIKTTNSVDKSMLYSIHPELTKIISNDTYLTNDRLSELYSEYLLEYSYN